MFKIFTKIKWASCRLYYYVSVGLTILTGGLFLYISAPTVSYYMFNSFAFWRYLKYFPCIIKQIYRILFIWLTDPHYRKMYVQPLFAPPLTGPDRSKVRLANSWQYNEDDCANCHKCCIKINCPLLDQNTYLCLSYNTVYWKYFSCGRYPASQEQIDYYDCKKWEMKSDIPAKNYDNTGQKYLEACKDSGGIEL